MPDKKDTTEQDRPAIWRFFLNKTNNIFFALFLGITLIFVYMNIELTKLKDKMEYVAKQHQTLLVDIQDRVDNINSGFLAAAKKLEMLENKQRILADGQSRATVRGIKSSQYPVLAEIESLLTIANHQLLFNQNIGLAITAMTAANHRLEGVDDPKISEIKEQISVKLDQLHAFKQNDLSHFGAYLSATISRVDTFPLKQKKRDGMRHQTPSLDKKDNNQSVFELAWQEIKSLVTITRNENGMRAHLMPDEIYLLRSNIKRELANARFAVFNYDTENLHTSILNIQTWLEDYFNLTHTPARHLYDKLSRMKKMDITFPDVDISTVLASVRALSSRMDARDRIETQADPTTIQ